MNSTGTTPLLDQWSAAFAAAPPDSPVWLRELRQRAADELGVAGLPTRKTEAWKYTPVRMLETLSPAIEAFEAQSAAVRVFPEPLRSPGACSIDICNGRLPESLSAVPAGVTLLPLSAALDQYEGKLKPLLSSLEMRGAGRAFAALNTAFMEHGLVVHVDGTVNGGTLLLRWAFSGRADPQLDNFRLVLLLEPGAELEIIEQFESAADTANALNVITHADLAEGAVLKHLRVQRESEEVVLLTSTAIVQAAASRYRYHGLDLGGGLVRHEISSKLAGAGAQAEINGAFVMDNKRHVDNHIDVDHAAPGCSSSQFFRGVLGGTSRGVWNGRALIRQGADDSVVHQSNANLLLSRQAEINTKPELEIYADEVEASHGATVGQLDETAVFYMRSRGLSDSQARRILTSAFCHAVTDRLEDRSLAEQLSGMIDAAMPEGVPVGVEA